MIIYQDETYILKYESTLKTIFAVWLDVEGLTDNKYKFLLKKYMSAVEKYSPENVLIDTSKGFYLLDEELSQWTEKNVCQAIEETNIKKIAFVVPASALHSAPFENMIIALNQKSKIKRRIFYSYAKAADWILS